MTKFLKDASLEAQFCVYSVNDSLKTTFYQRLHLSKMLDFEPNSSKELSSGIETWL